MTALREKKNITSTKAPVIFMLAALLPEYAAPVLTLVYSVITIKKYVKNKTAVRLGSIGMGIVIFFCWMTVSSFWSSYIVSSLASLGLWLLMYGGFFFMTNELKREEDFDKTVFFGALSSGIAGVIGVAQMIIYHFGNRVFPYMSKMFNPFWRMLDLLIAKITTVLPESIVSLLPSTSFKTFETRACATFSNPIFFASFGVMMIPFAAYGFLYLKERKKRIICLVSFLASVGGIICSYSRGPYLALVIALVVLFLYGKKSIRLLIVEGGALGISLIFAGGFVKRLLTLANGRDISVNTRTLIWKAAIQTGMKHPIFGYGTGFNNVRSILHNDFKIMQPHAHNIIFEIWLENGVVGVALLLFIFALCVINIIKLFKSGDKGRVFGVTFLSSVAGFFACGMTDCLFYGFKPLQYLLMIFGFLQAVTYFFVGEEKQRLLPKKLTDKFPKLKIF